MIGHSGRGSAYWRDETCNYKYPNNGQEKVTFGDTFEEACATKVQIQEVNIEKSGKQKMENKHRRNVVFQDCEKEQDDKTKDPTNDIKTPNTETKENC